MQLCVLRGQTLAIGRDPRVAVGGHYSFPSFESDLCIKISTGHQLTWPRRISSRTKASRRPISSSDRYLAAPHLHWPRSPPAAGASHRGGPPWPRPAVNGDRSPRNTRSAPLMLILVSREHS